MSETGRRRSVTCRGDVERNEIANIRAPSADPNRIPRRVVCYRNSGHVTDFYLVSIEPADVPVPVNHDRGRGGGGAKKKRNLSVSLCSVFFSHSQMNQMNLQ